MGGKKCLVSKFGCGFAALGNPVSLSAPSPYDVADSPSVVGWQRRGVRFFNVSTKFSAIARKADTIVEVRFDSLRIAAYGFVNRDIFTKLRGCTPRTPMRGTGTMYSIWRFLRDEDGPTAVEYAVMLALIILTAMSGIAAVGNTALYMWNDLIKTGLNSTP